MVLALISIPTMTTRAVCRALVSFLVVLAVSAGDDFAPSPKTDTLNIKNNCSYRVAPVIAPNPGSQPLSFTPVELKGYEYALGIPLPHGWSGRIWGRTDCSNDAGGRFTCATGDCGSGRLECGRGGGGRPTPAETVAEFELGGKGGKDAYGISLADGYNLPMLVAPYVTNQGGGHCAPTRCAVDLDGACPPDQQVKAPVGRVVACKAGSSGSWKSACPEAAAGSFSCRRRRQHIHRHLLH